MLFLFTNNHPRKRLDTAPISSISRSPLRLQDNLPEPLYTDIKTPTKPRPIHKGHHKGSPRPYTPFIQPYQLDKHHHLLILRLVSPSRSLNSPSRPTAHSPTRTWDPYNKVPPGYYPTTIQCSCKSLWTNRPYSSPILRGHDASAGPQRTSTALEMARGDPWGSLFVLDPYYRGRGPYC